MYLKTQALNLSERNKSHTFDRPGVLWLQGEDTCGLAVIAVTLEHVLARQGYNVTLLDHDQINRGLCRDLENLNPDRQEYARRVAEAAKLFDESKLLTIVMVDSLSPSEQESVRKILHESLYSSVYVQSPEDHERAAKAASNIKCIPEEALRVFVKPENPDFHLKTDKLRTEDSINALLKHLDQRGSLQKGYSPLASVYSKPRAEAVNETPISIAAG